MINDTLIKDTQIDTILPKEYDLVWDSSGVKRAQLNISIISFKISNKQLYHFFLYMWWLKKVKNSTVYFIRKFWKSEIRKLQTLTAFSLQHFEPKSKINDDLQCMMQVVYLHELGKIIWGKIHACYSLPRLKKLYPFTCDFLISLWLQ